MTIHVFDGHNDVLGKLVKRPPNERVSSFLHGAQGLHIDLPKAKAGGLVGGLFAVFPPSPGEYAFTDYETADGYDVPLPPRLAAADAQRSTFAMVGLLHRIAAASNGAVVVCCDVDAVETAVAAGRLATVLHLEGADPIEADLDLLVVLHAAGLRSLGPVWSRPTIFGDGVPFRFPSTPDTGPGLTEVGRDLVRLCNDMRIMIDLSHITEAGFWDVAAITRAPLVATHSNRHTLCPSARNLTDRQLHAIRDTDGVVGVNFATCFLREDGAMTADTAIDEIVRHVEGLLEALGETRVVFGSDFDGATVPGALGDCSGLPRLLVALRERGYTDALLRRIAYDNWIDLLRRTIG